MVNIKIKNKTYEFNTLVNAVNSILENDKKYKYNHICKCGEEQQYGGLHTYLKRHDYTLDSDYVCKDCFWGKSFDAFGKHYNSHNETARDPYFQEHCRCSICNADTKAYSHWAKLLSQDPNTIITCKKCNDKLKLEKYNNSEKHSEDISRRNKKMWKDKKYRKHMCDCISKANTNRLSRISEKSRFNALQVDYNILGNYPNDYLQLKDFQLSDYMETLTNAVSQLWDEWAKTRKMIKEHRKTIVYYTTYKDDSTKIKIGITYSETNRYKKSNKTYNILTPIRVFENRYIAAYIEYKLRTIFCYSNTETTDIEYLDEIIDYVNNAHYNNDVYNELVALGWQF